MSLEELIGEAGALIHARFGGAPDLVAFAPGRVNLIGEHTDYMGGLAMPAAVDRWVVFAVRRRSDRRVGIFSAAYAEEVALDLNALPAAPTGWLTYVVGALSLFAAHAGRLETGFDAVILGDVPLGAGMSSSAALECAVLNGLRALCGVPLDDLALVRMAQAVEHQVLGLPSGLLDQMASQLSAEGQILLVDFRDLTWSFVPSGLPDWRWVVVDTGVRRALATSAYASRVASVRAGLAALRAAGLAEHWRDATVEEVVSVGGSAAWVPHLRHGITENARVRAAARALEAGDAVGLGRLLIASHQSLRHDYAVSCPELDLLALSAWDIPGCAGARMMGGGFGGCTINLVRAEAVEAFGAEISEVFRRRFGRGAPAWSVKLVGGAGFLRQQDCCQRN